MCKRKEGKEKSWGGGGGGGGGGGEEEEEWRGKEENKERGEKTQPNLDSENPTKLGFWIWKFQVNRPLP